MIIKEFKKFVDEAYKNGEDAEVEFWIKLDDENIILAELDSIGQFHFVPDMTITIRPMNNEEKIYTTKIVDKEQFDYRKKYFDLCKKIEKIGRLV